MNLASRDSGIELIGPVPWGTHFCQFYKTKEDLLEILVPYFKAGLDGGEFCMWVTSEPLSCEEALATLRKVVPEVDRLREKGQIEIISYTDWYVRDGRFDAKRVLDGWVEKLNGALAKGYKGLRLTGNTFWLEKKDWNDFYEYEKTVNSVIGRYPMMALCTYSLEKCGADEILDVTVNHEFALMKRANEWVRLENTRHVQKIADSEARYRSLFDNSIDGFALHKIVVDEKGTPVDFVFLEANPAFEKLTGLKREQILGKKVTEVIPGIEKDPADWIGAYGRVALEGKEARFEQYADALGKWFSVLAYCPAPGMFVAVFEDVTDRRLAQEARMESESLLKASQRIARLGSWELDLRTNRLTWSDEVYRIFEVDPAEFNASYEAFLQRVHPDDREAVKTAYSRSLREAKPYDIVHRILLPEGRTKYIHERGETIFDASRKPLKSSGAVQDITELRQMQLDLQTALREKELLFREIHHRVKNNLQIIMSLLRLQSQQTADPATSEMFRNSQSRVQSMALVHEKLYGSKSLSELDLAGYLGEVVQELRKVYTISPAVDVRLEAEPVVVEPDEAIRCGLLVNELVTNSLKHGFPDNRTGQIVVGLKKLDDGGIRLSVQDSGVGLPLDFRIEATRGLGLRLVSALAEQMKASLEIKGEPGASFSFLLPPSAPTEKK